MHGQPLHAVPGMLLRRGIGTRPEDRPAEASTLSAPSEARSSLSALYGENGAAAATEAVDDAVLSGRTRTTNNHAIATTHQAADSNAALPRRERGAANAEAWRGDASRPLRAATAASTTSR